MWLLACDDIGKPADLQRTWPFLLPKWVKTGYRDKQARPSFLSTMSWSRLIGCLRGAGILPRILPRPGIYTEPHPPFIHVVDILVMRLARNRLQKRQMDLFSGVASVFAVCGQLETCINGLRQLYNTLKFAKQEVRQLIEEVYNCQILFGIFNDATRPMSSGVMILGREKKLDKALQTQATAALRQINYIMTKFKPLIKNNSPGSFNELSARLRWHFTRQEIKALMHTLNTVKQSLSLLSGLLALENSLVSMSTANSSHEFLVGQM